MTLGEEVVRALRQKTKIIGFHADWIVNAYAEDVEVAALSCPRGSAKTWIAGYLAALSITPGSPTYERAIEVLAVSASLEQSRVLLGFVREALADAEDDYRWLDSGQHLTVTHKATRTRLRILSSSGKRAMGLSPVLYDLRRRTWKLGAPWRRAHVGCPTPEPRQAFRAAAVLDRHQSSRRRGLMVAWALRRGQRGGERTSPSRPRLTGLPGTPGTRSARLTRSSRTMRPCARPSSASGMTHVVILGSGRRSRRTDSIRPWRSTRMS